MSGIHQLLFGGGIGDNEIVDVAQWSYSGYDTYYGFNIVYGGTCVDGLFAPCGGALISNLMTGGLGTFNITLSVVGEFQNVNWEVMKITNLTGQVSTFYRKDATFSSGSGSTSWSWPSTSNEFGGSGTAIVVFS